jgi:hydrogenase maturation protease
MPDFRDDLRRSLTGRVCLMGIGNPDRGDDGLGVRLAEAVRAAGYPGVIVAERTPEQWIAETVRGGWQTVVLLDAVEMGSPAGTVVLLDAREIAARFPQVSTHKLSLGTIARLIEAEGAMRVCLLGVQPACLGHAAGLSDPVRTTLEILRTLLVEILPAGNELLAFCGERP